MSKLHIFENNLIDQIDLLPDCNSIWQLSDVDPILKKTVNEAIEKLPEKHKKALLLYYYQGLSYDEIGRDSGLMSGENGPLARQKIKKIMNCAHTLLKAELADFVARRWKIRVKGSCRICRHPKVELIDSLLHSKTDSETWREFGMRLKRIIGENFHPPQILKAHLGHIPPKLQKEEIRHAGK